MTYTTWINRLRGMLKSVCPAGSIRLRARRIRPCLEVLEDRLAPATQPRRAGTIHAVPFLFFAPFSSPWHPAPPPRVTTLKED
jgi:hypothetical protein